MTIRIDDRTDDERNSHSVLITATDTFCSHLLTLQGPIIGKSKMAWACKPENAHTVFAWAEQRSDTRYVNCVRTGRWYPKNAAHVHIYVVDDNHPALAK